MKISEVIKNLQEILEKEGDLPCLIELEAYGACCDAEIEECSVENRDIFGKSVKFII